MNNKKGFTLVELLVTIILIAVIASVIIYNVTNISRTTNKKEYDNYVSTIKSAASIYIDSNSDAFNALYVDKAFIYIKVEDLVKRGLLDEKLRNPYTKEIVSGEDLILVGLDTTTGGIDIEYPIKEKDTEVFLVALSDYVVWGEEYNCMQGAGTYQLSLSDENGNLISLSDPDNIEKYEFSCSMPKEFDPYRSGTYTINYNYVTKSGKRKKTERILKVLSKATLGLDVKDTNNVSFDPKNGENIYTPTLKSDCKTWNHLMFTPTIDGADKNNTEYRITIQNILPELSDSIMITDGFTNDFKKAYDVYDGKVQYQIEAIINGHHDPNYYYETKDNQIIYQDLVLDTKCLISSDDSKEDVSKNFTIKDTYSKFGVLQYEFRLVTDETSAPSNGTSIKELYTFPRDNTGGTGSTTKAITIEDEFCPINPSIYKKIYFRAINNKGYKGPWSVAYDANISNDLYKIITTNKGETTSNCQSMGALKDNQLLDLSCYYSTKQKYVSWKGIRYVVLGLAGNSIVLTTDQVIPSEPISLVSQKNGNWILQNAGGIIQTNYTYLAPNFDNAKDQLKLFMDYNLPINYKLASTVNTWHANIGAVDTSLIPKLSQSLGTAESKRQWEVWNNALKKVDYEYSSYVGIPTKDEYEQIFKSALDTDPEYPFWLASTFNSSTSVSASNGESVNILNTHFYAVVNNNTSSFVSENYINEGTKAYVKPIIRLNKAAVCSGTGEYNTPYVLSEATK